MENIHSQSDKVKFLFDQLFLEFQKHFSFNSLVFPDQITNIIKGWKNIAIKCEDLKIYNEKKIKNFQGKQIIFISPFSNEFDEKCFFQYFSLTSINLPSSLQSLGNYCFYYCSSLTSINYPSSLQHVGQNCFSGCCKLPLHIENQFLNESSRISDYINSISGSNINKIKTLETSNFRISFTIYNEQIKEIKKWKSVTIIYENFKIENNIISKLKPNKHTIILHPIIESLGDSCFSEYFSLT
jgi:hypothetical protein